MNDNKSRDIFYGVVAIATLIVAIIGATLAYFSITANSSEGAVNAKAATVSIDYEDRSVVAQADQLIPSTLEVVQSSYENHKNEIDSELYTTSGANRCLDANGRQVCSVYRFSVKSDSGSNIIAYLNTELNEFSNYLSYAVRKVTIAEETCNPSVEDDCWMVLKTETNNNEEIEYKSLALGYCDNDGTPCKTNIGTEQNPNYQYTAVAKNSIFGVDSNNDPNEITLEVSTANSPKTYTYDLVVFLMESGSSQNTDQGKTYNGTIKVELPGAGSDTITGVASNNP